MDRVEPFQQPCRENKEQITDDLATNAPKGSFLFARSKSRLYITIKIPISPIKSALSLFKIISVPVPINTTSPHASQLLGIDSYLAITTGNDYYTTIDKDTLERCSNHKHRLCSNILSLSPITHASCDIAVRHPVNLALLQSFFSSSEIHDILPDTTFPQPLEVDVPKFQLYNHTFSTMLAADQRSHLSLARMAESAKRNAMVFRHLAEPILSGDAHIE
ncbi:uncharacterized protein LOC135481413 [Liolophura sinensis]|uniref:uncharacterized protein LOC135481413 n=1 Tax=Liolophura sinensis TaxID=3198878 RepID=UPI0031593276